MKTTMNARPNANTIRWTLASFLMIVFYCNVWGSDQPSFTEGAELYVHAHSGLILRAAPDQSAEIIDVVPFGSKVLVLTQDSVARRAHIEWVSGEWLYVEIDGAQGYMFDGYLSELPVPTYEFEKTTLDLDLLYPLQSWTDVNLVPVHEDTLEAGSIYKVTTHYLSGDKRILLQRRETTRLELTLSDVRIMDAYHLLQSMLDSKGAIDSFKEASIFIKKDDSLSQIKIDLDIPVKIKKLSDGKIKIMMESDHYHCSL